MPLSPGTRLGSYEILAPIGAGGMGEVYRARDPRIGREVAIKVLPSALAADTDRLRRFEQEVRASGSLNHPNILTIHDVGTENGSPFIVSELLEGETLRQRMGAAALPQRKAIEYAQQIARGLAAAHEKDIVHRDLKPENIFIVSDGRVKILDFGLAKLKQVEPGGESDSNAPTIGAATEPGILLGTMGYMSPEQVRGRPADHRSDIFAFGAILYEMLTGQRAFQAETAAEVMTAILKQDPPALSETNPSLSPALERIVRHCLEKSPQERFQSARDLAFGLEALSGTSVASMVPPALARLEYPSRIRFALLALAVLAVLAVTFWIGKTMGEGRKTSPPVFRQLSFRRGTINAARFAPDGQTIIYGAAWDGQPTQLFSTRPESPESRPLGLPDADVLSISRSGEMAISLGRSAFNGWMTRGTLARTPLAGGAPREILENVQEADWSPDGSRLAIVRDVGGRYRLEFPAGKVLYETEGWISHPRLSPKGDRIAFLEHPIRGDDAGSLAVVDLAGNKRELSGSYASAQGVAWAPSGSEIWYTAADVGYAMDLRAVTVETKPQARVLARVGSRLGLQDLFPNGRVLLTRESVRASILGVSPGESRERDFSWLDNSFAMDLSDDGKRLLISEEGAGGGPALGVYLRKTDGSPAVRIGDGYAMALSPDGKFALTRLASSQQLVLLPTGPGEAHTLPREPIESYQVSGWFPDGKRILFAGNERGHRVRLYVQDADGGKPRAITKEGISISSNHAISPNGLQVLAADSDQKAWLYPVEGGEPHPAPGVEAGELPVRWSSDARSVYVFKFGKFPARVYRVDLTTGRRQLWKELMPADLAGISGIAYPQVSSDGRSYFYTCFRQLSDLFLVEGLK